MPSKQDATADNAFCFANESKEEETEEEKAVSNQDTALTADDANISTTKLVLFYVSYHLRRRLDKSKLIGLPEEFHRASENPSDFELNLVNQCLKIEKSYAHEFHSVADQLDVSTANVKEDFYVIAGKALQGGITWGGILSLITFTGVLSEHLVLTNRMHMVADMTDILTSFLNERIVSWVNGRGGWVRKKFVFGTFAKHMSYCISTLES